MRERWRDVPRPDRHDLRQTHRVMAACAKDLFRWLGGSGDIELWKDQVGGVGGDGSTEDWPERSGSPRGRPPAGLEKVRVLVDDMEENGRRMCPALDPAVMRRLRERLGLT